MRLRPHLPFPINAAIIAAGALLVGKSAAADVVAPATSVVVQGHVVTEWRTKKQIVKRVVRGRVVVKNRRVYVRVPVVLVHVDHRTIRVPQQLRPLKNASARVALPLVPVTVTVVVPGPSPAPVTVTSTVTSTDTVISVETTTISLPLIPTTSDQ